MLSFVLAGRRYLNKRIFFFAIIVISGLFVLGVFRELVLQKGFNEVISLNVRTSSWLAGLSVFKNNIIAGAGIGQSVFFMPLEMENITDRIPAEISGGRFPPMNTYIQWMAETGIVGLLILVYLFLVLLKYKRKVRNAEYESILGFGFGGGLIAIGIAINALPDFLYVGCLNFLLAMYVVGFKVFSEPFSQNNKRRYS